MSQFRCITTRLTLLLLASLLAGLVLMGTNFIAQAAPNQHINYQGKLTDTTGVAVADGTYNM